MAGFNNDVIEGGSLSVTTPVSEANGGSAQSTYTTGDILYASAANTLSKLAVSTDGKVLTLASGVPSWATASGGTGSYILIQTQTAASSASLIFSSGISSTYYNYMFLLSNVVPATNATNLLLDISTDGGSTYLSTGFNSGDQTFPYSTATQTNINTTTHFLTTGTIDNTNPGCSGRITLFNITNGAYPCCSGHTQEYKSSVTQIGIIGGQYTTSAITVNAMKWTFSSGNISTGTISLYGISK